MYIPHHTLNLSLHYLVKYLCSKIAILKEKVKQTVMQDIATQTLF